MKFDKGKWLSNNDGYMGIFILPTADTIQEDINIIECAKEAYDNWFQDDFAASMPISDYVEYRLDMAGYRIDIEYSMFLDKIWERGSAQ